MEAERERKHLLATRLLLRYIVSYHFASVAGVECQVKIEVKHTYMNYYTIIFYIVVIPFLHRNYDVGLCVCVCSFGMVWSHSDIHIDRTLHSWCKLHFDKCGALLI